MAGNSPENLHSVEQKVQQNEPTEASLDSPDTKPIVDTAEGGLAAVASLENPGMQADLEAVVESALGGNYPLASALRESNPRQFNDMYGKTWGINNYEGEARRWNTVTKMEEQVRQAKEADLQTANRNQLGNFPRLEEFRRTNPEQFSQMYTSFWDINQNNIEERRWDTLRQMESTFALGEGER